MWGAIFPAFIAGVAYVYDVSRVMVHPSVSVKTGEEDRVQTLKRG
jgi:hypothetical protein